MDRGGFDVCFGILFVLLICFGFVGNIISMVTWSIGRRCKRSPGKLYLIALAVSDTWALCLPATELAVEMLFEIKISDVNPFLCTLEYYGLHFGLIISAWTIACFTVERTIAVAMPFKWIRWRNRRRTIVFIAIIFISNILANLPWAFGTGILAESPAIYNDTSDFIRANTSVQNDDGVTSKEINQTLQKRKTCRLKPGSFIQLYENEYHFWFLDFVVWFVVPLVIITVSNIIISVIYVRQRRQSGSKRRHSISEELTERHAMTTRAVALSIVHCVCAGSFSVAATFPDFFFKAFVLKVGHYYYAGVIIAFISFANHSINPLLYSLFGTAFRRDCVDLLWKRSWCGIAKTPTETNNSWAESTLHTTVLKDIAPPLQDIYVISADT